MNKFSIESRIIDAQVKQILARKKYQKRLMSDLPIRPKQIMTVERLLNLN